MPKKIIEVPSLKSVIAAADPQEFSFERADFGTDQSVNITAVVEGLITSYQDKAVKGDLEALSMLHRIGIMASVALMQVMAKQKKWSNLTQSNNWAGRCCLREVNTRIRRFSNWLKT